MKKLWGIRHIRWLWLSYRTWSWAQEWARMGIGLGHVNESDMAYLNEVWHGRN